MVSNDAEKVACVMKAREANEEFFVAILHQLTPEDRAMFHIQLLEALLAVIEPNDFKTLCKVILVALEAGRLKLLSGDPATIHLNVGRIEWQNQGW